MAAVTRRQYKGAAAQTTISNALASGDTSATLAATTGWPSGADPFFVVLSPGTASEEKCRATIAGSVLTLTRAQDDTTANTHASGATIYPVFTADDADEANLLASRYAAKGDVVAFNGTTVAALAVGTNDHVLTADSATATGLKWAAIPGLADGSVTTAKIVDANVTGAKLANAEINDQTASYTLVLGDRNKRVVMDVASANTVTVDDSIFGVGDTIFIANKGAGATTVTAGAGVTINSASGLELVTSQSGQLVALSASSFLFVATAGTPVSSGLTLITAQTIGTAVSSVPVNNVFSSTYDDYRITITGGTGSANDELLGMILGATTTGYYNAYSGNSYNTTGTFVANSNATSWTRVGGVFTDGLFGVCDLFSPNLAKRTNITGFHAFDTAGRSYAGYLNNTTAYTGFTLTPASGTLTGGTIRVYGYKNS